MQAIAVRPGTPHSVRLLEVPKPTLGSVPGGRGVLVRLLRCGVDGTDKEIDAAEYGAAPPGDDYLILGHEGFGQVVEVGANVTELRPGDYVVATVRRPGSSLFDRIGTYDMTTDDVYFERGINLRHGFLTEFYVDEPEYIVKVPRGLKEVGVLLEPFSIAEKGIAQAFEIQRRLRVWRPRRAAIMGSGSLGLLASLSLRLRGFDVTTFGQKKAPYKNAELLEEIGVRYVSTAETPVREAGKRFGPFDLILEATGYAPIVFECMEVLAKNGVLVLASVTGGDHKLEVPADRLNLGFVLGNKVMVGTVNANREYFEMGVRDMAMAEAEWPGWLSKLLTHPVRGLAQYEQLFAALTSGSGVIKAYCEIASV